MKKTLLIKSKNEKNFISSVDGQEIKYYWYKAEDTKTEITYNFGSQKAYSVGEVVEVELEKTEGLKGFIYKEPSVS